MPIVVLSPQTINKIAAGEVIDCPASAVKELMENSIDAGATTINVEIDKGGRNLISVSDNGCGIAKDEMEKAFICHATSKLVDGDLTNVKSMGFRGEGLTSIAAVARVKMVSRHWEADKAWSVVFEGGEKSQGCLPEALSCGTYIEVRDLFFATPARLKFLRTERAEIQGIVDLINKLAIIKHWISFSLTVGDKQVFKYPMRSNLLDRLCEIKSFGETFREQSIEIFGEKEGIQISGRIGIPTYNKSKSGMIYTFVNGRPIHSTLLMGAIKSAYSEFITKDRYPVVVLCLDIAPANVDVNVHPSKLEVRFQNTRLVYSLVVEALKEALSSNVCGRLLRENTLWEGGRDHFTVDSFEKTSALSKGVVSSYDIDKTSSTKSVATNSGGIFVRRSASEPSETTAHNVVDNDDRVMEHVADDVPADKLLNGVLVEDPPLGSAVCQIFARYIVSQSKDCVIIVDQHAAHERLTYEYMRRVTEEEGIKRQVLLMPEFVELGNQYELELLSEHKDKLLKFGLVIEPMGDLVVVVREVPAIFGVFDAKALVTRIVGSIMEVGDALFMSDKVKHVCGTIACYGSIRSGRELKIEEMNSILRQMESTPHSGQCNHGRPTYVKLTLSEIDKLFERR